MTSSNPVSLSHDSLPKSMTFPSQSPPPKPPTCWTWLLHSSLPTGYVKKSYWKWWKNQQWNITSRSTNGHFPVRKLFVFSSPQAPSPVPKSLPVPSGTHQRDARRMEVSLLYFRGCGLHCVVLLDRMQVKENLGCNRWSDDQGGNLPSELGQIFIDFLYETW